MQIAVNNVETRFDAEQVFLNEIDSNNTPKNIKEVCEGTRIEETSISGNCPGLILNNYKRLPQNPRCFACRTLRDRLFTKAARQRTAANKKYKSQIPLKRLKNKCNLLQKKAITDFLEEWESGMEILGDSMPFSESTLVGFKVTLASTLEITDMMHNEYGFEYFMTSRLSQDYLEQLFSIMSRMEIIGKFGPVERDNKVLNH
ncbi:uncharacterized protein LOC130451506 isoform X2 [Diorhabda sublineata]|uniref:uncharacterized protein LOC130451506 isoform X2 n=1 Tax=Diorhabda sublineata TaxID=1163346 RepID=UPI0024E15B83|nr:uncharacterized protein LOC130451506 isoform X2 [Diorhabda sublineata]